MKAVAYIRKSTFGTDDNGQMRQEGSFDRQRSAILDYAKRSNLQIIKWYEEPVSGKSVRKRKVFLQMVKDAKSPARDFDHIIFGEYDRFMRHVKEAMRHEVELDDAGVNLHFTNLKNDGSTADQIYKSVVREMAAEYSRELARKVIQGMYRKAQMGSWLGGVAPFGYKRVRELDSKVTLAIVEEQAETVRKIFNMALSGLGHKRIARHLNEQGILSTECARKRRSLLNKNPDGKWSGDTVRYLLRNPIYKGALRWNKQARVDCFDWNIQGRGTVEIGKLRTETKQFRKDNGSFDRENAKFYIDRTKSKEEWVTVENAVPAIVSPEIFDKVQKRFASYRSSKWQRKNDTKYLMSNALRCGSCGNSITGHRYSKVVKTTGKKTFYYYYRCQGDIKKGTHAGSNRPMIRQEAVDKIALEGMKQRIARLIDPGKVAELFKKQMENYVNSQPDRLGKIEKEIAQIEKEIKRMIFAYTKFEAVIPDEEVNELKAKKQALEAEKESLIASEAKHARFDLDKEVKEFLGGIKDAEQMLNEGSSEDRIRLREAFLPKTEVRWYTDDRPARVDFYWRRIPQVCRERAVGPPPYSS